MTFGEQNKYPMGDTNTREESSIKSEIQNFCSQTTAHGISHIGKESAFTWYRICWLFIVLGAFAGNGYHLYSIVNAYIQYPTQEVSQLSNDPPKFPEITVCNNLEFSVLRWFEELADADSEVAQYQQLWHATDDYLASSSHDIRARFSHVLEVAVIYANLSPQSTQRVGHSLRDFIVKCTFMGVDCNMDSEWVLFRHPTFLNCYTFKGASTRSSFSTGPETGLSLILSLDSEIDGLYAQNYRPYLHSTNRNSLGVRVVIHEANTYPLVDYAGINVAPGYSGDIALRTTTIKKLDAPYGKCTKERNLDKPSSYRYTTDACTFMCMNEYILNTCGCRSGHGVTVVNESVVDESNCLFYNNETVSLHDFDAKRNCYTNAAFAFSANRNNQVNCDCKEGCEYYQYDKFMSLSKWPTHYYMQQVIWNLYYDAMEDHHRPMFFEHMEESMRGVLEDADNLTTALRFERLVRANFARVNIYFETLDILERKQTKSITLADLFAGIGGTIGLWAGLSIITIVEFLFFLSNLAVIKCKQVKAKTTVEPMQKK